MMDDLYPTRHDNQERLLPRLEPTVYGAANSGPLDENQLKFYDDNGYLILPGALANQVDNVLNELPILKQQLAGRDELILEPESGVLRSIFSPELYSDTFASLSKQPLLLGAAQQILGSQVYIHHSRVNIKAAFDGKSFPWHSDFETWHAEDGIPHMRIVTGWVFLTENNEFNGSLFVIPKSHKQFVSCVGKTPDDNFKTSLRKQTYGVPSHAAMRELAEAGGMVGVYGPPGTVVFHEGNLMHGSADNISAYARTNLFFVYNSVKNLPQKPFAAAKPRPEFLARHAYEPLAVDV